MKLSPWLVTAVLFCSTVIGGFVGYLHYQSLQDSWVQFVHPPIQPVHIAALLSHDDVRVQTKNGQFFLCDRQGCTSELFAQPPERVERVLFTRDTIRVYLQTIGGRVYPCSSTYVYDSSALPIGEVLEVEGQYFRVGNGQVYECGSERCSPATNEYKIPVALRRAPVLKSTTPTGRVVEHKAAIDSGEWIFQTDVVLMEDGSLWSWSNTRTTFLIFPALSWTLLGAGGGLALSTAILFVVALLVSFMRFVRR